MDVLLVVETLTEGKIPNRVTVVEAGTEAMAFLRREGTHRHVPRPDLIVLDLNLPGKGGREVLAEIKTDEGPMSIPAVILATSRNERDIVEAYALHANCYITKPTGLERFVGAVKSIEDFWLTTVELRQEGRK
jgi:CheY-like chemotaxis protein